MAEIKRILQITSSLERNGTETFIMNVFRNLDHSQFCFDFLVYKRTENGFEAEAEALGARIFSYHPRGKNLKKYISSLEDFFRRHAQDYVAVHFSGNSFTELLPVRIAKKYNIPVRVVHSHNTQTYGFHNKLLHRYNRRVLHKVATHYLACSRAAKDWGFKGSSVFEKAMVVPNGINLEKFKYNPEARDFIRKNLGISSDALVIGNTGGFRPVKNHEFLIEIFSEILKIRPESHLLLCGGGETEDKIKKMVEQKSLSNSVHFLGVRSDIEKILCAIDIFIFPSFYEGLPFTLIEAQASGVPIIASDAISAEISLTPCLNFKSLDNPASDWAAKALSLLEEKRLTYIHHGLREYDVAHTCKILENLYQERPNG